MQIDELPAGEQNQCPDMDMNRVVGTHDILMLCFDTLRYDVSKAEEACRRDTGSEQSRWFVGEKACAGKFYLSLSFCYFCRLSSFAGRASFLA